ncbi:MAG: uroporphyrinogen-III synthase, partial [Planctomycetales bacterium]|nr:uroporphyrinogen-III synthase [Planctomycetales bacterium]
MASALLTIINTRSGPLAQATSEVFHEAGFEVIEVPLREQRRTLSIEATERVLRDAAKNGALVALLSPSAAGFVAQADAALLSQLQLVVLGEGSAKSLRDTQVSLAFVGEGRDGAAFAKELLRAFPDLRRVVVLQSKLGREAFGRSLKDAGIEVEGHELYDNIEIEGAAEDLCAALKTAQSAIVLAYAPSAVETIARALEAFAGQIPVASIGPTTSKACQDSGLDLCCEASEASNSALLAAVQEMLG